MLLIGLGAGLLLPTATNSVVGSVPQGDSGIGSATNAVALQVGGALGVAVIGSVMSTRYQDHMTAALAGRHVPAAAAHTILGSLGGALAVAGSVGGATGALLAHAARAAFMSGNEMSLAVGAAVALGGAVLVLARLPSRTSRHLPDPGADSWNSRTAPTVGAVCRGLRGSDSGIDVCIRLARSRCTACERPIGVFWRLQTAQYRSAKSVAVLSRSPAPGPEFHRPAHPVLAGTRARHHDTFERPDGSSNLVRRRLRRGDW